MSLHSYYQYVTFYLKSYGFASEIIFQIFRNVLKYRNISKDERRKNSHLTQIVVFLAAVEVERQQGL